MVGLLQVFDDQDNDKDMLLNMSEWIQVATHSPSTTPTPSYLDHS